MIPPNTISSTLTSTFSPTLSPALTPALSLGMHALAGQAAVLLAHSLSNAPLAWRGGSIEGNVSEWYDDHSIIITSCPIMHHTL